MRRRLIVAGVVVLTGGAAAVTSATWQASHGQPRRESRLRVFTQQPDPLLPDLPAQPNGRTGDPVVDGDTIRLRDGRRVRLAQIDAPELGEGECYSNEAAQTLDGLLPSRGVVRLERDRGLDRVDRFGRLVRYVSSRERNLNLALVRRGAASVWFAGDDRGRHATRLLSAARHARRARRGLWGACPGAELDPSRGVETGSSGTSG